MMASSHHGTSGSSPAVPDSLMSSVEEAVAQLCLPSASQDAAPIVISTVRSIHSLLGSSSHTSVLFQPLTSTTPLPDALVAALTALFQSLLLSRQYERALSLLSLLPTTPSGARASPAFVSLRADLLRRLVLALSQSASIPLLTSLPFGSSLPQVTHVLYQQAQHSDLSLSDPSTVSSAATSPPRYYDLLYAVLLHHHDHAAIASTQYHYALRIQAEGDLSSPHVLSLYIHVLQRVFNALSLTDDGVVSVAHRGGASVVSRAHVYQRLQLSVAQVDLLAASTAATFAFGSASPVALMQPLLQHDLFDRAVSLAAALEDGEERQRALDAIVVHLAGLLSREASSGERAVFHVEDHRVLAADADDYFPPPSPSPVLHCLRTLLASYDDSTFHLRSLALSLLLASPLSLTIPRWLLSHHRIPAGYTHGAHPMHEDADGNDRHVTAPSACFAAVTRTLLEANRLDLAVEAAVRWLEERDERLRAERADHGTAKRRKEEAGVEWNVLEDLMQRLQQAKRMRGMDDKATELVATLHGTLTKALAV